MAIRGIVAVWGYIYPLLGRTLLYPVHGTTSYKSGLVLLGEHKFYRSKYIFLHFFELPLLLTITTTMVKMTGRKKPFPGSSAALRAESRASEDALDNPGAIPEIERLSSIRDDPIALRRRPRLGDGQCPPNEEGVAICLCSFTATNFVTQESGAYSSFHSQIL